MRLADGLGLRRVKMRVKFAGAKCEEIAIVYATIGGAALGYVTEALLGNHDGHQYIINVDESDDDIAIVQGSETLIKNGERANQKSHDFGT